MALRETFQWGLSVAISYPATGTTIFHYQVGATQVAAWIQLAVSPTAVSCWQASHANGLLTFCLSRHYMPLLEATESSQLNIHSVHLPHLLQLSLVLQIRHDSPHRASWLTRAVAPTSPAAVSSWCC